MPGEVLTLQFGHFANFVGAHWWNVQERSFRFDNNSPPSEIDHSVLFREGLTSKHEVTFTPRLLLVDLKGSLQTLSQFGDLYAEEETIPEDVTIQKEEPVKVNSFQADLRKGIPIDKHYELESEVSVWSDFLYGRYHPRTVNIVKQYQHNNTESPFDMYPLGEELWKHHDFSEGFTDKIRNYLEESDSFQGFHLLTDSNNAFSGLSTSCLEYLKDEYDSKTILAFAIAPQGGASAPISLVNQSHTFDIFNEHTSLFIPLANAPFPHLKTQPIPYHESAVLASALDTLTLIYRLKKSDQSMGELCRGVATYGRGMAAASLCLPFPLDKGRYLIDCLDQWEGPLTRSITPNCKIGADYAQQALVLRGVSENSLKRPPHEAANQRDMPAYSCHDISEMLDYYVSCTSQNTQSHVTSTLEQLTVKAPFPRLFPGNPEGIPVLAGVHNGKFVGKTLEAMNHQLERINFKGLKFQQCGLTGDDFKDTRERLMDLADCYDDKYLI